LCRGRSAAAGNFNLQPGNSPSKSRTGRSSSMRKTTRSNLFLLFLLGACLAGLLLAAAPASALPPEIKDPIDKKLYQGDKDKINEYVLQRREQIKKIIATLEKLEREDKDKDLITRTAAVKDLYLGLLLQYKILLSELNRSSNPAPARPEIKGPPYKVRDLDQVISYQRQINSLLSSSDKEHIFLQSRLGTIENSSVSWLSDYARIYKTHPERKLELYRKYCKILNLQNEYAILRLRKPRLEKLIAKLEKEQQFAADWVNQVFTDIEITPDDLKKAESDLKKAKKAFDAEVMKSNTQYQEMSRRILVLEARLNRIVKKIKQARKDQKEVNPLWLIDKEKLDLAISSLQFQLRLLNQQRTNARIKFKRASFRYQWLKQLSDKQKKKNLAGFIKQWDATSDKLSLNLEEVITSISDVSLARSNLTQRQVTIRNRRSKTTDAKLKNALGALSRQADKTLASLDQLALVLTSNDHELRNTMREISQILSLTRYRISNKARFRLWSETHFTDFLKRVQQVLYYPIFSFGNSTINLYIILKIIILFLLGLGALRYLRRKIERLLAKRAGMSPGAINSITTLGYYACILLSSVIILQTAGLDLSQLGIIVGALGVGIGFGLQTITNNFISGIILLTEQSVKVGDYITLEDGVVGEVRKMTIRSTVIRTADSEDIIVPNSDLISNQVRSWSYNDDDWRRLDIPFGVSYDADPDEVARLAEEAAREVSLTREDYKHKLSVFFEGFGDNSLDFSLRVWCRMINLKAPAGLKTDYYFALFRKLKKAGIEIPYPQRDLHLQSLSPRLKEELRELLREFRESAAPENTATENTPPEKPVPPAAPQDPAEATEN
jgi:small-conductance mechanosensitive channel